MTVLTAGKAIGTETTEIGNPGKERANSIVHTLIVETVGKAKGTVTTEIGNHGEE
jgi:hypothetical protein